MIFWKKKQPEEEEEIPQTRRLPQKEPKEKTQGRKKKEPPRPWGKSERILIFALLGGTTVMATALAMSARAWKLPGVPRLSLSEISFEKTYVFEKEAEPENFSQFINSFEGEVENLSGIYGFSVYRLDGSASYGLYEDELFTAASLIKLPVIVAIFKEAEKNNIDLDDTVSLEASDKYPGGSLSAKPTGSKVTYRELARLMGQESDNTAFRATRRILGADKIETVISDLGMANTSLSENETTPSDIVSLFRKIFHSVYLSSSHRDELLEYLTDTIYEDRIPAGVPDDVRVAHKIGTEVGIISDAGIVFSENPYIIVIMSKGVIEKEATEVLPELSRLIYENEGLAN